MDGVCLVGVELQLHFGHDFDMTRLHSTKLFTEQVYAAAFTHYGDMLPVHTTMHCILHAGCNAS